MDFGVLKSGIPVGKSVLSLREFVLVAAFVLGALYMFKTYYVKPRKKVIAQIDSAVATVQNDILKNQGLVTALSSRKPASKKPQEPSRSVAKYAEKNGKFANIVRKLTSQDEEGYFQISRIHAENEKSENGYLKTLFGLNVNASFFAIGNFLEKLEESALLTEVITVDINRIEDELRRCSAEIKLYSYVANK